MPVLVVVTKPSQAASLAWLGCHLAQARETTVHFVEAVRELGAGPSLEEQSAESLEGVLAEAAESLLRAESDAPTPVDEEGNEEPVPVAAKFHQVRASRRLDGVLYTIEKLGITTVIAEKVVSSKAETGSDDASSLARDLYAHAPCSVIVLRPGEVSDGNCQRILVPSAGSPSSLVALQVADDLAKGLGCAFEPLYVEPPVADVSEEVGEVILRKVIAKSGIDKERATPRVVLAEEVYDGIARVAYEGTHDLIVIGSDDEGGLRRVLFGSLPEKLLSTESGVAVVRPARPLGERMKRRAEGWLSLRVPQIEREHRVALFERLETGSRWSFDFMMLICLSTAIAALGLVQDSAPVVIGAMLVAPLMTPLLGSGLALIQGNLPLVKTSAKAVILGFLCALVIGVLVGFVSREITPLTSEMAARGGPSLLDMGVAFFSGIAASYCIARPGLASALAGVAIAAALVPPIATTGIALAYGEFGIARGAALLFGTNVVTIVIGAALSFWGGGIRSSGRINPRTLWTRRILIALIGLLAVLTVPLGSVLVSAWAKRHESIDAPELAQQLRLAVLDGEGEHWVRQIRTPKGEDGDPFLEIEVVGTTDPPVDLADRLAKLAREQIGEQVRVFVIPRRAIEGQGSK